MKKKDVDNNIADSLNLPEVTEEVEVVEEVEVIEAEEVNPIEVYDRVNEEDKYKDADADYSEIRRNLKMIIDQSSEAIEGILDVAKESEHPRAYEVVSQLIHSSLDANTKLVDLHKKMKEIKKEGPDKQTNITNNSVYVGSTKELQSFLHERTKQLEEGNPDG